MKTSWKTKSSNLIYKNPWIKVSEDEVIRPDGNDGTHTKIEMKTGVTILPIDEIGNVCLIKEYQYAVARETLEAISGGIDKGEDKLHAAKRELAEEVGIEAIEWIYMGVVDPFTTVISSPNHMYVAKKLKFKNHNREGTEQIEVVKIPLKDAVDKVGVEITHGASSVLILKASNRF